MIVDIKNAKGEVTMRVFSTVPETIQANIPEGGAAVLDSTPGGATLNASELPDAEIPSENPS